MPLSNPQPLCTGCKWHLGTWKKSYKSNPNLCGKVVKPEGKMARPTRQSVGSAYCSAWLHGGWCGFCCCSCRWCCFQLCVVVHTDPTVVWSQCLLARHSFKTCAQVVLKERRYSMQKVLSVACSLEDLRRRRRFPGEGSRTGSRSFLGSHSWSSMEGILCLVQNKLNKKGN